MPDQRLAFAAAAFILVGCARFQESREARAVDPVWQPLRIKSQIDSALGGVWVSHGYGLLLEIGDDEVTVRDISPAGCIRDEETAAMLEDLHVYALEGETLRLSFRPENATQYVFDPVAALPPECAEPPTKTPSDVLEYFWGVMRAHYAFFDLYGVDWEARHAAMALPISDGMSEGELFDALAASLEGLQDSHLGLRAVVDGQPRRYGGRQAPEFRPALNRAFEAQSEITSFGDFAASWARANRTRIQDEFLGGETTTASGGNIMWGRSGRVGYILIVGMDGFAEDAPFAEQIEAAHAMIGRAVTELADTEALIVDIALNQGGSDEVSLAIASHFADEERIGLTKYAYGAEDNTRQSFTIVPTEPRYLKPVYLLTSDVTVSAAETFALEMRALPNVNHVGATTRGSLSDVLIRPLPNGWILTLSNEVYLDNAGLLWEGRGITPEEPMPVFAAGLDGYAAALRTLFHRHTNGSAEPLR